MLIVVLDCVYNKCMLKKAWEWIKQNKLSAGLIVIVALLLLTQFDSYSFRNLSVRESFMGEYDADYRSSVDVEAPLGGLGGTMSRSAAEYYPIPKPDYAPTDTTAIRVEYRAPSGLRDRCSRSNDHGGYKSAGGYCGRS